MTSASSKMDKEKPSLIRSPLEKAKAYEKRVRKLRLRIDRYEARLQKTLNARLVTGGVFFSGLLILTLYPQLRLELFWIIGFALLFSTLVFCSRQIRKHLQLLKALALWTERQMNRMKGLPSRVSADFTSQVADLDLPQDLDLVGNHSLLNLIDETLTDHGLQVLLRWLSQTPLSSQELQNRQEKIRQLTAECWYYTRLGLTNSSADLRISTQQILSLIKDSFLGKNFRPLFYLTLAVWTLFCLALTTSIFSALAMKLATQNVATQNIAAHPDLPNSPFSPWAAGLLLLFILTHFMALRETSSAFLKGVGLTHHLEQLAPIFKSIEKRILHHPFYQNHFSITAQYGPYRELKKLTWILSFLGIQTNPILYAIINAFVPWSLVSSYWLEKERLKLKNNFLLALEELANYEALMSLATFARLQTQTFPIFSDSHQNWFSFKDMYHPLLNRANAVTNSFTFEQEHTLGLLTGSNMSGKSTFLRMIGLNQTLANLGAPVFASQFHTRPLEIETCIAVSDSLRDGYSYFYSEVRRISRLLKKLQEGHRTLYLIDEIFRGTNNRERRIGSQAVLEALAKSSDSIGFVSTHDLELTDLEKTTNNLVNLHFREEFQNHKMHFTYRLWPGPCPTTNALYIMKLEGIEVPIDLDR